MPTPARQEPISNPDPAGVLVEIGHPAHVHFFARSLAALTSRGIPVHLITRNKDITNQLLDRLGLGYRCLSRPATTKFGLLVELCRRWWTTFWILKKQNIRLSVSISGITTAVPSRLAGVRTLTFQDTEDAKIANRIAVPFSDLVITPDFYETDYGERHVRYDGLHELAYLQDFDFDRAARIRKTLGLPERYVLVRRVANDAVHDWDIKGFSHKTLVDLVERLQSYGKVYFSSEGPLPPSLEPLRLKVPLEQVHAVLAGAQLFAGESPTMAVEASVLGTPSFLVSQRSNSLGNMKKLAERQLLVNCGSFESLEQALADIEDFPKLRASWSERAREFREQSIGMSDYVTALILKELASCAP